MAKDPRLRTPPAGLARVSMGTPGGASRVAAGFTSVTGGVRSSRPSGTFPRTYAGRATNPLKRR
jgi:hypothetical protein